MTSAAASRGYARRAALRICQQRYQCRPSATVAPRPGSIALITGPMFAGKTTALMRHVERCRAQGLRCLLIGHALDAGRHDENCAPETLTTHGGTTAECVRLAALPDDSVDALAAGYDVIAVDEGQFFAGLAPFCRRLAGAGVAVAVAALDMDFRAEPFEEADALAAECDSVLQLCSRCAHCGGQATRTARTSSESSSRLLVGGRELYAPLCAPCYDRDTGGEGIIRSGGSHGSDGGAGGVSGRYAY